MSSSDSGKVETFKIIQIAIGFLGLYSAIFGTQNALSLALEENGYGPLGFYSVGIVYISWGIGAIFSTSLFKRLGSRWCVFLGASSNAVWMYSMLLTVYGRTNKESSTEELPFYESTVFVYIVVIACSIYNGFFNGPMWVSACSHIYKCATKNYYPYYFSLFWMFYVSSQMTGNALASMLFGEFDQQYFFIIMGTLAFSASVFLSTIRYHDTIPSKAIEENLLPELQNETTVKEDLKVLYDLILDPKMRLIIPQIFFTGVSISYYTGIFVPMIFKSLETSEYSENQKFSMSMFVMILLGAGAVLGTILGSQIYSKFGHRVTNLVNLGTLAIASFFTMNFVMNEVYDSRPFMMAFFWGIMDAGVQTHTYSQLGIVFENKPQAYSIYNIFQSIAVLIFCIVQTEVFEWESYFQYAIGVISIGFVFIAINSFLKHEPHTKVEEKTEKQINE